MSGKYAEELWRRGGSVRKFEELFSELVRFETEIWNVVDARLREEFDLPLSRFEPMQVIVRTNNCRVYDIADQLGMTVGGVSKLVDRIEAAGYCERRSNPQDRRSSLIELTSEGEELFIRASAAFEMELDRRIGSVLSEKASDDLVSLLSRLREATGGVTAASELGVA